MSYLGSVPLGSELLVPTLAGCHTGISISIYTSGTGLWHGRSRLSLAAEEVRRAHSGSSTHLDLGLHRLESLLRTRSSRVMIRQNNRLWRTARVNSSLLSYFSSSSNLSYSEALPVGYLVSFRALNDESLHSSSSILHAHSHPPLGVRL